MSQDITEARPLLCLLEMVCEPLKDSLKGEGEAEKVINAFFEFRAADLVAGVSPKPQYAGFGLDGVRLE